MNQQEEQIVVYFADDLMLWVQAAQKDFGHGHRKAAVDALRHAKSAADRLIELIEGKGEE